MNNVIKLLNQYIDNNRLADEEFIIQAINYLINENDLYNIVKYIELIPYHKTSFNDQTKQITINKKMHYDFIIKQFGHLMKHNSLKENITILNLNVLTAIFHEITHCIQLKYLNEDINSFEHYLIYLSFERINYKTDLFNSREFGYQYSYKSYLCKIIKEYSKNKKFYFTTPTERLAYLYSNELTLKIIDLLDNKYTKPAKEIFTVIYKLYEICDYEFKGNRITCPIDIFFKKKEKYLKKYKLSSNNNYEKILSESHNYDLKNRLLYGLPITPQEYEQKIKELINIKTYKKRRI